MGTLRVRCSRRNSDSTIQRLSSDRYITMRAALSNWVTGVVVAFLLICPHLRVYLTEDTRYWTFWGRSDAIAFAIIVLLLGTAFFLARELTRLLKVGWADRVFRAVFLVGVGFAVIAIVRTSGFAQGEPYLDTVWASIACLVGALGVASLLKRLGWIPRVCRAGCLVVSPIVPLVLLQVISYPPYSIDRETLPSASRVTQVRNLHTQHIPRDVFVFILDEWSYPRTFAHEDLRGELPNLARLTEQSTVFHDAHSPSAMTETSLPSILFQTSQRYGWKDGKVGFSSKTGEFADAVDLPNLFSEAKESGHRTFMVGFAHPYRLMFGPQLDYCYAAPEHQGNGDDRQLAKSVTRHLWYGLTRFALAAPKPAALRWRLDRYWQQKGRTEGPVERLSSIHELAKGIIRDQAGPCFGVFHYSLPHWPLIFTREGVDLDVRREMPLDFAGSGDGTFARPDPRNHIARYRGNLHYMDTLIGELIDVLTSSGRFDDALLVFTSDHSWRVDPLFDHIYVSHGLDRLYPAFLTGLDPVPSDITHVPLIVKHPHQTEREEVHESFLLIDLQREVIQPSMSILGSSGTATSPT